MKKIILILVVLISAAVRPQLLVVDDFESGLGHFTTATTYSGSTVGVLPALPSLDSSTAARGTKSCKVLLIDDPANPSDWFVRFLSAIGTPGSNTPLGQTGYIGFWIKANRPYLKCGFIIDDLNANGSGVGTNEISDSLAVDPNGNWKLLQWSVADSNRWFPFIPSGNGLIQDPVTIDAIFFAAPATLCSNDTVTVYLDHVSYNPAQELPVELVSFDAVTDGNRIDLRWVTATELNNKGFEIQRSCNGGAFTAVGFVPGRGTASTPFGYTWNDRVGTAGKYAYRLRQIDFDGTSQLSHAVETDIAVIPGILAVLPNYPNPFNPATEIRYTTPAAGSVEVAVYNVLGQKVAVLASGTMPAGEYTALFNAADLPSGTYICTVTAGGKTVSTKMSLLK